MSNVERIVQSTDADDCTHNIIKANMKGIRVKVNKLDLDDNDINNIANQITGTIKWTGNFECGKLYTNIPEEARLCNIIADTIDNPSFCNSNDLI
ncbi:hypothetical protein [Candidatus Mesenet endosymbiont of Agriotes lineatus]|uniref:hypothetical protein n=1 Tax=Candidatus Mesenet endosymbiont of Agriotes lineatus TaxID=3077948 RepID=UPI0030CE6EC2